MINIMLQGIYMKFKLIMTAFLIIIGLIIWLIVTSLSSSGIFSGKLASSSEDAPPKVRKLSLNSNLSGTKLTLSWKDPVDSNLDHIEITYEPNENDEVIKIDRGKEKAVIKNLKPNITYTFDISAVNIYNNRSDDVSITKKMTDTPLKIVIASFVVLPLIVGLIIFIYVRKNRRVMIIRVDLKDDYVLIKNNTKNKVNLDGWKLTDSQNRDNSVINVYTFNNLKLGKGEVAQIQAGNTGDKIKKVKSVNYYIDAWNRKIWNDSGDTAYLYDKHHQLISKKKGEK